MRLQLKQILLLNSFFVFANEMFAPLYAIYVLRIESAVFHVGAIWGFFIVAYGILTLVLRNFENKQRYALYFMIANFMLRIAGWAGYIFAAELWQLYAIQLLFAVGEALGTPSYDMLYSTFLTRGRYASDWGADKGLTALVMGAGAFAGGIIVQLFGFTPLFMAMISLSLLSIALSVLFRRSLSYSW